MPPSTSIRDTWRSGWAARSVTGTVIVLLVAGGLGACGRAGAAPPGAAGCVSPRELTPGTSTRTITSAGAPRSYLLHVPPGYRPSRRAPLVVMFHGLGGDPATVIGATGMAGAADARDALLVVPLGQGFVPQWTFRTPASDPRSDLAFVRRLVKTVKRDACVDSSRVYAAGYSNGSALTMALACDGSTQFAAYGAVAGPYSAPPCAEAPASSIIYFHGRRDAVVPFEGGDSVIGPLPAVDDVVSMWTRHDRCPASGATTTSSVGVQHFIWSGCEGGSSVEVYAIRDGRHGWPSGGAMSPGGQARTRDSPVDATRLMWEFFDRHAVGGD